MKDFKKRSLVLMLASVMTVTGSFASDNYKNCIMDMAFKQVSNNEITLVLSTKRLYEKNIIPIKKDKNTYVIMLSEFDITSSTPDLSAVGGLIESVDVKKMPYANGNKGYTRLVIKTGGDVHLLAYSSLYIPSESKVNLIETQASNEDIKREIIEAEPQQNIETEKSNNTATRPSSDSKYAEHKYKTEQYPIEAQTVQAYDDKSNENSLLNKEEPEKTQSEVGTDIQTEYDVQKTINNNNDFQKYIAGLWVLLIIMVSIYLYQIALNKQRNVLGEQFDIDVDDEQKKPDKSKQNRKKEIYNSIKKIDNVYEKTAISAVVNNGIIQNPSKHSKEEEELNIVDLDALFNEQNEAIEQTDASDEENEALDDFLSGFSFDETELSQNVEEELFAYDEDAYEQIINNKDLVFTEDDMICFNELLKSEISSDVMNNPEKYLISNPIAPQKPSQEKVLANLIVDYAINQNINFTAEDIEIFNKLLNIEIDPDFVTDLRTNPERTKEVEREIRNATSKQSIPKEILTLKVSDMLPNLDAALKAQGNKPIEYDVKPETVYCSEGYEVNKFLPNVELPNLSGEINNKKAYISKPSKKIQIVDNRYNNAVSKLTISGLPDLEDVMANPEKYEDAPQKEFIPDENELLDSIKNVQFKPFYDGTNKFEIINDDIKDEVVDETQDIETIQNELNQFDNFEIASEEDDNKLPLFANDNDDFESLYNENEYFDIDALENSDNNIENENVEPDNIEKPDSNTIQNQIFVNKINEKHKDRTNNETIEDLLRKLESINNKAERNKDESQKEKSLVQQKNVANKSNDSCEIKCFIDGVNYEIISTAKIKENFGCHLARSSEKFVILAFNDKDNMKILKEYDSVKGDKIQARFSENSSDGASRYLVRIGLNKIVVELKNNDLYYVMDL